MGTVVDPQLLLQQPVLPVIDISTFLQSGSDAAACTLIAEQLAAAGVLIIRDPRVADEKNEEFLDLMEDYFNLPEEEKAKDARPDLHYQLGPTPEGVEVPRDHCEKVLLLPPEHAAHKPVGADPKWRFFWRIGDRPESTEFPELNAAPVVPANFPTWETTMNTWGQTLLQCVETVSRMAALGFHLPPDTFTDKLRHGPHLLAPTGSDLTKYNKIGQIFAGYHYDLNFITIHGKSRYAGLYVWLRNGTKMPVRVPKGCLILQAGKQFEWLTGGRVLCGYHEVVVNDITHKNMEEQRARGRPLWRVSSTLFSHVASDANLDVLPQFVDADTVLATKQHQIWPCIRAGQQVAEELGMINLKTH